jgi:prolyl-tRNA synthetase
LRWTKALIPTLKETPSEAEVISHQLMLRAGLMRPLASGIYTYLPLGWRTIRKVEQIVREEMDKSGALEILMPVLSPAELWRESGRWDVYGRELMRLDDRHDRPFALGPTHEEVVTDLVRRELQSYKSLPLALYQIQTKFRDELRPRFGVMRGREFIMKDAYSFHADDASLDEYYQVMYETYTRIFARCGLKADGVLADSGAIGGKDTHEFTVPSDTGETQVIRCAKCGYAATDETADGVSVENTDGGEPAPLEEVHTPERRTVDEVCRFLEIEPSRLIKTLIFESPDGPVVGLVRGDRELNHAKLQSVAGVAWLEMATPVVIKELTGAGVGFAGPAGLEGARVFADKSLEKMTNLVSGANKTDYHVRNVNPGRDFQPTAYANIMVVEPGDGCVECGEPLEGYRAIEVGQVFKLGRKYSEALGLSVAGESEGDLVPTMGCYGIGVTRTVAAIIEQHHDKNGIVWPMSVAPYQVLITEIKPTDPAVREASDRIYADLMARGVEVLLDDRDERPGFKFKDADLVGIPLRVTIGPKGLAAGKVEVQWRRDGERTDMTVDECPAKVQEWVERDGQ